MSNISTTQWPKPYILEIYRRAVEEGCVRIGPLGGIENYKSLAAAFYRIRRGTDKQHELFVKPSYHLCTCTWEPFLDSMLVTYDKLPDGIGLPSISSVDASTLIQGNVEPIPQTLLLEVDSAASEVETPGENFDSESFVQGILSRVGDAIERDDGEIE